MEKEREHLVYLARLAEQAERYDGIFFISMDIFFSFLFQQNFDYIYYSCFFFFLFFVFAVLICRCMIFYSF